MKKLSLILTVLTGGIPGLVQAAPIPSIQWTALAKNTNTLDSANALRAVTVDPAGNTFIAANLGSDGVLLLGTNRITAGASGGNDILLAKLDSAGKTGCGRRIPARQSNARLMRWPPMPMEIVI